MWRCVFFFKQRTAYEMRISDWSSDVCSSELGERTVRVAASENPEDLGPQDSVVVALKAHSVPAVARSMTALFHDAPTVVTAVNGVPWWYFHGIGGPLEGTRLATVDPGDARWEALRTERATVGGVKPAGGHDEH